MIRSASGWIPSFSLRTTLCDAAHATDMVGEVRQVSKTEEKETGTTHDDHAAEVALQVVPVVPVVGAEDLVLVVKPRVSVCVRARGRGSEHGAGCLLPA